jgi:hypothetical protein
MSSSNQPKPSRPAAGTGMPTTGTSSAASRQASGQPWQKPTSGAWLFLALGLLAFVALVYASGRVQHRDERAEDDAGVVHPQPLGVDDDVAPRHENTTATPPAF